MTTQPTCNTHAEAAAWISTGTPTTARMAAIRAARADAESLKARILDADDLEARLQELRERLPVVSMQFSHEK